MVWNKRMLTTEDANSIIQHFGKCFIDYFVVDTILLETEDSIFAYDFITITRTTGTIGFNIKNELWTGAYSVLDCNIESPTVSVNDTTISVSGTGLTYVVLELELSSDFKHDSSFEMDYKVKYDNPVIAPFYEESELVVQFLDTDNEPVSNLSVYDPIAEETLTTDNNGKVTITIQGSKAGDYYYPLQITNNSTVVEYKFSYKILKAVLPFEMHNNILDMGDVVFRANTSMLLFTLLVDDGYGLDESSILANGEYILRYNNKEYIGDVYNRIVSFYLPVGDVDTVDVELVCEDNPYLDDTPYKFSFATVYPSCDTLSELRDFVIKYDVIMFNGSGDLLFNNESIEINHDVKIIFTNTVTIDNNVPLFTLVDGAKLVLDNFNLDDTGCIVEITDGNVRLNNCNINHVHDTIIKGNGDVELMDCAFVDNNQVLDIEGTVVCNNVLFDLADTTYLDNSKVPFLDVYGDLKLTYCDFNIELMGLTTLGYSYVVCKIGAEYSTNNVNNNKLFVNEAFPVGNNNCNISVESDDYRITSKSNKAFTWNIINTNTVFSNKLNVEHLGDD